MAGFNSTHVVLGAAGTVLGLFALQKASARGGREKIEALDVAAGVSDAGPDANDSDEPAFGPLREIRCFGTVDEKVVEMAVDALRVDGVVCLRGLFSEQLMADFRESYDACWDRTKQEMTRPGAERKWTKKLFEKLDLAGSKTPDLAKCLYHGTPVYQMPGDNPPVVRMGVGRYDFEMGKDETVLSSSECLRPEPIRTILTQLMGSESEWISYPGGLPAEGPCSAGRWHRDPYSLWEDEGTRDADVSPFYFTVIVPLTKVAQEDGPTQFRLGSHRLAAGEQIASAAFGFSNLELGDALLFDGRILHRGGPRSKQAGARHVFYAVHHKWWYQDDEVGSGIAHYEDLSADEVAQIEAKEPWLKKRSRFSTIEMKHLVRHGLGHCDAQTAGLFASAGVGILFGYFARTLSARLA